MPSRDTEGSTRVDQETEGVRGKYGQEPLWGFSREGMSEAE